MQTFTITTGQRTQFVEITREVQQAASVLGLQEGVLTVYIPHTTAGVTINEHADPDVMTDLRQVFDKLIPWEDHYRHLEGNTAAHAKTALVGTSAQVLVVDGRLQLGTWQGIFFCEFDGPRSRNVWVSGVGN